ncbi:hypothetical protein DFH08DRAFT_820662 [Mycena albidolilacea]|uniref:Uncharacterized protein n=1 Tax=Mycena albidolilacea TaxID=1033008 RepID=A0AAD7EF97_9AGAR|nr:hypothetical protein DFH08DRAFT_820662 [Mycena albidolilacea]
MFGQRGNCPGFGGDEILEFTSLPALETLCISQSYTETGDDLVGLLNRSSAPLLELVLEAPSHFVPLVRCLRLTPDLMRFEVRSEWPVMEGLLAALADSPSLLPHLNTLVVHLDISISKSDFPWASLSHALSGRCTIFRVFQLEVPRRLPASQMPPTDVIATFRALAVDGTQVRISATLESWDHIFR